MVCNIWIFWNFIWKSRMTSKLQNIMVSSQLFHFVKSFSLQSFPPLLPSLDFQGLTLSLFSSLAGCSLPNYFNCSFFHFLILKCLEARSLFLFPPLFTIIPLMIFPFSRLYILSRCWRTPKTTNLLICFHNFSFFNCFFLLSTSYFIFYRPR